MSLYQRTAAIAAFSLMLGLAASACGKKQAALTPPPPEMPTTAVAPPAPPAPPGAPNAAATPRTLSEDELFAQKTLAQLNNERPLGDVYFDLDNAAIKDEGKAALSTNATYLKRWPSTRINIEGHCDERGTAEYNLALGERRANAVKAHLVELGVPGDRIVIVSKGKEAPFCTEKNEACWQQNRRGHFIITAK
ncbi:MAG TPA: peptidoglycan-associated lipoprotein Pal [Vicinamibacterales bacterium]|jgi:peptidoglycan-associated lipoprotein|nr:peptidoglycan-associated lipoprotein Pal [Vicinamibacterales bacterium]